MKQITNTFFTYIDSTVVDKLLAMKSPLEKITSGLTTDDNLNTMLIWNHIEKLLSDIQAIKTIDDDEVEKMQNVTLTKTDMSQDEIQKMIRTLVLYKHVTELVRRMSQIRYKFALNNCFFKSLYLNEEQREIYLNSHTITKKDSTVVMHYKMGNNKEDGVLYKQVCQDFFALCNAKEIKEMVEVIGQVKYNMKNEPKTTQEAKIKVLKARIERRRNFQLQLQEQKKQTRLDKKSIEGKKDGKKKTQKIKNARAKKQSDLTDQNEDRPGLPQTELSTQDLLMQMRSMRLSM